MKIACLACLMPTTPLASPVGEHALIMPAAVNYSQEATAWDRPYFDLKQNRNRLISPHLRGAQQGLGE